MIEGTKAEVVVRIRLLFLFLPCLGFGTAAALITGGGLLGLRDFTSHGDPIVRASEGGSGYIEGLLFGAEVPYYKYSR